MRRTVPLLLLVAAVGATSIVSGCTVMVQDPSTTPRPAPPPAPPPPPPPPAPRPSQDVGYFYDELDPYGDWLWVEPHGWVWAPVSVDPFWRPYTVGQWVWSDWGWTWASGEPWGWATYHYGRWVRMKHQG